MAPRDSSERLTLSALARMKGIARPTVTNWARRGVRGHRLAVQRLGGRVYTTLGAFERFNAELAEDLDQRAVELRRRGTVKVAESRRDERAQRAAAAVEAMGLA